MLPKEHPGFKLLSRRIIAAAAAGLLAGLAGSILKIVGHCILLVPEFKVSSARPGTPPVRSSMLQKQVEV